MSRVSLSANEKDSDSILLNNRGKFKKVFGKHLPNREGKITLQEFLKFCQNVRILQDLITPIELKRLIAQQSIKQNISYSEFEVLIKNIAQQTFNNTAPLYEKLRMLLIHIRNSCKMHYQVSLNQNFTKETSDCEGMQDPVEIALHSDDPLKSSDSQEKPVGSRFTSVSPPRDNDSESKSRMNSIKKDIKDRSVSPCNKIVILDKVLQQRFCFRPKYEFGANKKTGIEDEARRKSVSPYRSVSPISISPLKNVKDVFLGFCSRFNNTTNTAPKTYTGKRVQAQFKYIQTVRRNTFQGQFVKRIIFIAWRKVIKDKSDKML